MIAPWQSGLIPDPESATRAVALFGTDLYAVADQARSRYPVASASVAGLESSSLFAGPDAASLWEVAPFLIRVRWVDPFLPTWAKLWGAGAGIMLSTTASTDDLRRHLRRFLMVNGPDGEGLYFRFYDPRVLRAVLPACNPAEIRQFFGPIRAFWCEGTSPHTVIEFTTVGGRLEQRQVAAPWAAAHPKPARR